MSCKTIITFYYSHLLAGITCVALTSCNPQELFQTADKTFATTTPGLEHTFTPKHKKAHTNPSEAQSSSIGVSNNREVLLPDFMEVGPPGSVPVDVLGMNDMHGAIYSLASIDQWVKARRHVTEKAGGTAVLLDAGDIFQGTLESNLQEGKAMIAAYNALGVDAAAIGNHEFDFGPIGPKATPSSSSDDPQGALKARIAEAQFPFLTANILDRQTQKTVLWPNTFAHVLLTKNNISIGVIGVSTEETPRTTTPINFTGLQMAPLAKTIMDNARILKQKGADIILVAAHAGGHCTSLKEVDSDSCDPTQEIYQVASQLDSSLIHGIVAGHTHDYMAHTINNIPVIESYANGRALGHFTLWFNKQTKTIVKTTIYQPHTLCEQPAHSMHACDKISSATKLSSHPLLHTSMKPFIDDADQYRRKSLGLTLKTAFKRDYANENALGNMFADWMNEVTKSDIAMINGGGLRADLPAGRMLYEHLFLVMPFDNRFITFTIEGRMLKKILLEDLGQRQGGIFSYAGFHAEYRCTPRGEAIVHKIILNNGNIVSDTTKLKLTTSDYLVQGGNTLLKKYYEQSKLTELLAQDAPLRDRIADYLTSSSSSREVQESDFYNPQKPRLFNMTHHPQTRCGNKKSAP